MSRNERSVRDRYYKQALNTEGSLLGRLHGRGRDVKTRTRAGRDVFRSVRKDAIVNKMSVCTHGGRWEGSFTLPVVSWK